MKKPLHLDQEERELLKSFEAGEWQSVPNLRREIKKHERCARATLLQDRRVSVRLSSRDLEGLQTRAAEDGIPYQTLIASILHRFVAGRLVEK